MSLKKREIVKLGINHLWISCVVCAYINTGKLGDMVNVEQKLLAKCGAFKEIIMIDGRLLEV